MKHFIKAQAKLLVTVLTLVVVLGIGATVAYLHDTTDPVTNRFDPAQLDTKIEETVDTDGTKNVVIANTGKSNAYVRARIMVSGIAPGNVEITTKSDATKEDAQKGQILLVMPQAGEQWQKSGEDSRDYSDDWYYFCKELPGTNQVPDDPTDPDQANLRKTSALLEKVYFGTGVNPSEITITITHESVLAIPGDQTTAAGIEEVFTTHK